jgi:hypothetical protein
MTKKIIICVFGAIFLFCAGIVIADKGPEEMTLQAEKDKAKKPKPAVFPHKQHQKIAECGDCHHSGKDGKQVPYAEGQKIAKCESCHFKGSGMDKKLETFKGAAHVNCKACHKEFVASNPERADEFKGCLPCHPKK